MLRLKVPRLKNPNVVVRLTQDPERRLLGLSVPVRSGASNGSVS
jgi:hypothetical protein